MCVWRNNKQFFTHKASLGPIVQIVENGLIRFGKRSFNVENFQRPDWIGGSFHTTFKLARLVQIPNIHKRGELFFPFSNRPQIRCRWLCINMQLAALELRTKRLEDFEVTATEGLEKLQKRCSDAEKRCKDKLEAFEGELAKHNSMIAKLESKEQEINSKMEELKTKDLYLEAYSRRENIKFINIREPDSVTTTQEDTEEILRNFLEDELGYRDASTVEIQRVYRLGKKKNDDEPRPILARFLRYKDCEDILSLGHRLQGSNFQMFRDLPYEIVKRRKDQMATLKKAKQLNIPAFFSRAQPDKLYVRGKLWPVGKALDTPDDTYK